MGQTLTHGVYLPDEGERNCYSGLAANWQLLDNSVGTIAGKAPAVHTHTKSAITDLLNSNFIPSANNSYDLGSSSYQWNNVYSKGYYYNGTAWGLDKANVWTNANYFTGGAYNNSVMLVNSTLDLSQGNSSITETNQSMICLVDSSKQRAYSRFQSWTAADQTVTVIGSTYKPDANSETDFSVWISNKPNDTTLHPYGVTNPNLGNSIHKWKTLNGVNPGALSLPNSPGGTGTVNVNYYDLSGNITIRDGSAPNSYTAPCDGWIAIQSFATWLQISNDTLLIATTAAIGADGFAQAFLPVRKGNAIRIVINQTNTPFQSFKLLPCEGNV